MKKRQIQRFYNILRECQRTSKANLANDEDVNTKVYLATIVWIGNEIEIAVLSMGLRPLLGTALLQNQRLVADFWEDGNVTILPRS